MEDKKIEEIATEIADSYTEFDEAEWVFQFNDEEPIVFAWSEGSDDAGEVIITLKPHDKSSITFRNEDGSKTLSLYARPISEETKKMRESS